MILEAALTMLIRDGYASVIIATATWIFATSAFPGVYDGLSNMQF